MEKPPVEVSDGESPDIDKPTEDDAEESYDYDVDPHAAPF
jgi:hypothetical protein